MITPGMMIKHELEKRGTSLAMIARALKVTRSYVSQIINGKNKSNGPKAKKVRQTVSQKIKANPQDLWGGDLK
jgi:plasmid maintenance system antidote protein VapI